MSSRHRDEIRPPIASPPARVDPRAEPDAPAARDVQMARLARIALVRRSVAVEPEERPVVTAAPPRADFARPPVRPPPAPPSERGVWCFRPSDDRVEVVELPDED
ncbi:MAG: hypothetical protein JWM10_2178 [Myxococcaceae bacterium]|nr:hypothetical protein [Myxococcaceae bacterium]